MSKSKMRLTFGSLSITNYSKKIIHEILDSNRLSCGKYVQKFEEEFAALIGTREAVAVSSGTDADALALAALYDFGARRQDEVIIPALTFVATANAVLQAGFKPVFVDIERSTLSLDPVKIEAAITDKTKAIMPVHLMGKPADMDAINALAKKHKLYVIEDAAQAHGAVYKGRNIGTLGDMAAFSLYIAHIITTVEGGVITTNDHIFAEVLRSLRSHGRACKCKVCVINTKSLYCPKRFNQSSKKDDIRFIFERVGFSAKMNELEAAIGIGNLKVYKSILNKRRESLYYLMKKIEKFAPYIMSLKKETNEEIGPHALALIIQEQSKFSRSLFVQYLAKKGIDSRILFSSIPTQCPGFNFLGYKSGDFPIAEYIGNHGIHVGVHQEIGKRECDYLIQAIGKFLRKNL